MVNPQEVFSELTELKQYLEAFPVINQLRTDLSEESYLEILSQMRKDGYRLFAIYKEQEVIAVAGLAMRVNFYNKKHVFIYDLVTDSQYQSKGYGNQLLNFIDTWAKSQGAQFIALESGIQRTKAHRFYEDKQLYDKWCYSFRKKL
ncbi:GNAT family N-acetyltransferase [Pseudalkalibacillus sp. A8]|uniref:GNAT family N-acetyltransferase n=1 Tax=Pseudalkalibacillus sp. A8 TaxID=3382641 RepID=UPI0038B58179